MDGDIHLCRAWKVLLPCRRLCKLEPSRLFIVYHLKTSGNHEPLIIYGLGCISKPQPGSRPGNTTTSIFPVGGPPRSCSYGRLPQPRATQLDIKCCRRAGNNSTWSTFFKNAWAARIKGAGTKGNQGGRRTPPERGAVHTVSPDRIEAVTFLIAAASLARRCWWTT